MNPLADIIVPWRGGCEHREFAWQWIAKQYAVWMPEARVVTAELPPGPWVKGSAVRDGLARCTSEVVVVADADVWCDGLGDAIRAVQCGAAWAVPHLSVHRLTEASTETVFEVGGFLALECEQRPYPGILGGGLVVLPRTMAEAIPIDPRFVGWGQEDETWGLVLYALLGPPWRGEQPLAHLWHPPQERMTRTRGSRESWLLRRRYFEAREDPTALLALLGEAHDHFRTAHESMHGDTPEQIGRN